MNIATTIKPSGVVDKTNAPFEPLTVNDVLWSDTIVTWSDVNYNWSVPLFTNNAVPPQIGIENMKSKMLIVETPKP